MAASILAAEEQAIGADCLPGDLSGLGLGVGAGRRRKDAVDRQFQGRQDLLPAQGLRV